MDMYSRVSFCILEDDYDRFMKVVKENEFQCKIRVSHILADATIETFRTPEGDGISTCVLFQMVEVSDGVCDLFLYSLESLDDYCYVAIGPSFETCEERYGYNDKMGYPLGFECKPKLYL